MKPHVSFRAKASAVLLTLAACLTPGRAATFTVTPAATSNTYAGVITLQIGGLTNGEPVVVEKFLDANRNGVIDDADVLWQQFELTDGHAPVFHDGATAVTNLNVPGDLNAATGQITAAINLAASGFEQTIVGQYLIAVSSPFGNFSPVTNLFTLTNFSFGQSFSGAVVANSTNVPDAVVLLFQPVGKDVNPQGGAVADNSGNFTLSAPPGDYVLVAFRSNCVANLNTSPQLSLGSGATITTNLDLTSADRTIAGRISDASNSVVGLPGVMLPVQSQDSLLCVAFTDGAGNFTAGVTSNQWKVELGDQAAAFHGYLRLQEKPRADATTGSVSGVSLTLPKADAIFYGSVRDGFNQPMPGISLFSQDNSNQFEANVASDANGNYFAGALSGTNARWRMEISNDRMPSNYVFSTPSFNSDQNGGGTNLAPGQALLVNFTALLATNHITGRVLDANSNPIVGVQVFAGAFIGGQDYSGQATTDNGGNYSINVANGGWNVSVTCQGGDQSLESVLGAGNFICPSGQFANITNNSASATFIVMPCGTILIGNASPLPNGVVSNFYSQQFFATSCNNNFNWTLNSGSLPPGLGLATNGVLNGTPTTNGTFNFTVHVSDNGGASTNQNFSLTITPPAVPPVLSQASKAGSQFQFTVSGSAGLNYVVQMSTNLGSTNWASILVTNPAGGSFLVSDPAATNGRRFYRVRLGP